MTTSRRGGTGGDSLLLGIVDDAYLAYFAAAHVHEELPGMTAREIASGRAALAAALPPDVVGKLEREVTAALDEIEAFAIGGR